MQKKRALQRSPKQLNEFEGEEKHIWRQRLKKLTELRFKEIEEESVEEDTSLGRREHDQS